ncbi:SDR family NAD(P)-dependent oxidoreductase [Alcaligenes parafaecalis]|uniref:SDR family NAD(P)-dependent oxidoreductase n=1 Tax=Alcaligenes parafaecalis TaxID=171260 RepID=A0ABT3VK26_9BURK|nr:SDR family oxidoreductase [Alcaligenes parafaecalis]MCX5463863.1 SDR family NAD(P)-dependent oxidoreductase [Alcaligenes parafaecalis]
MNIMIVGASMGLGRALMDGLAQDGNTLYGVARRPPSSLGSSLRPDPSSNQHWICADLSQPDTASQLAAACPDSLDVLVYNLGIWEDTAFSDEYDFLSQSDQAIRRLVDVNLTGALLVIRHLLPHLLRSKQPRLILTGSTSGLRQSGRPEVAFGATKFALNGLADSLREGYRDQGLAVSCLQLGYLNTEDGLDVPLRTAAERDQGETIPVHDVLTIVRSLLQLSAASFIRELILPALRDPRF